MDMDANAPGVDSSEGARVFSDVVTHERTVLDGEAVAPEGERTLYMCAQGGLWNGDDSPVYIRFPSAWGVETKKKMWAYSPSGAAIGTSSPASRTVSPSGFAR